MYRKQRGNTSELSNTKVGAISLWRGKHNLHPTLGVAQGGDTLLSVNFTYWYNTEKTDADVVCPRAFSTALRIHLPQLGPAKREKKKRPPLLPGGHIAPEMSVSSLSNVTPKIKSC